MSLLSTYLTLTVVASAAPSALPQADLRKTPIKAEALKQLVEDARAAHSDALVVLYDGKVVVDERFGRPVRPIEAMSATKSVVSLAVGLLLDEGKIRSLDEPVSSFFPEWKQGRKKAITVRHLLNHTSGLQNDRTTEEIYASPDFVKLALAAELSSAPGEVWSYNNKAVNLLSGIVQVASGKRMDEYLKAKLFLPLGITQFTWTLDGAGNPHGMSGLQIDAMDFAKVGQLLLNGGVWQGKRILSKRWIDESTMKAGQPLNPSTGLLWWLDGAKKDAVVTDAEQIAAMRKAGVDETLVKGLETLKGRSFNSDAELMRLLAEALGEKGAERYLSEVLPRGFRPKVTMRGAPTGFSANGYLGQYVVVIPGKKLVAVRQYAGPDDEKAEPPKGSGFEGFSTRIAGLVP